MAKIKKEEKNKNKKNSKSMENEIIIGVTTKPKEKVRVENKPTRTKSQSSSKDIKTQKNTKVKINQHGVSNSETNKKTPTKKKITKDEKERELAIKKRNRKKVMLSIIIVFLIALGGTIYYLTTPVFNVANIKVFGNEKNSAETYISLSKIEIGTTNLFAFTNNKTKENIKENPYVEDVTIKRKLPNTVELYITERNVAYQIEYAGKYIYLDHQGYLLEISEKKKEVPIIKGFNILNGSVELGERLEKEDLIKLNVVSKVMNYCKYNMIENEITSFDVTDPSNYLLNFTKDGKIVYLGDASNLSERLSLLKTILKNEKGKKGEIFMNGDLKEDKIYFREKEEKKEK